MPKLITIVALLCLLVSPAAAQDAALAASEAQLIAASPSTTICASVDAGIEINGRTYSGPDLEAILAAGTLASQVEVAELQIPLRQKIEPQQNVDPCSPTEWPYCYNGGCNGLPLTGQTWIDLRPSIFFPGVCLFRYCQYRLHENGGTCAACSDWAYTTC